MCTIVNVHALKFWTRLLWLSCLLLPIATWAGRPVRVYEIDIKGQPSPAALQEALKRVLVRATGRSEAASDPALAAIVADAGHFMQTSRVGQDGSTHVVFDAAALTSAISAAGRSTWDSNRPFTLVVLSPPLTGPAADGARRELDAAAEARGLPISLVPLPLADASGAELGRAALLAAAQQLGGDAILIGRSDTNGSNGAWQWTLYTSFVSQNWSGGLTAGLNGAVDALARVQDVSEPQAEMAVQVEVDGVSTLADYAQVGRLLQGAPGVRSVDVAEASGTMVTFSVRVRGGSPVLDKALAASGHFTAGATGGSRMQYTYRP
ncbi:MAG TPA: DUF2066 domain-containing protein [Steroidobacteraceae bacterium]